MLSIVEGNQYLLLQQNCLIFIMVQYSFEYWWLLRRSIHILILWTLKVLIKVCYSMHILQEVC